MNGQDYTELMVSKKSNAGKYIFVSLCVFIPVAATLALALLVPILSILSVPVILLFVVVFFCGKKYFDVEYEYLVFEDNFDIDVIYGKKTRRSRLSVSIRNAEIIAPRQEEYSRYLDAEYAKVYDFLGEGYDEYFMVTSNEDGERILCLFSVNKKLLSALRRVNPHATVMAYGLKD